MSYLLIKLILIGDSSVGKSSMLYRFVNNSFNKYSDITIGVEYGCKYITIGDKEVKMQIWDTAGQEKYRSITRSYYRNTHGILLCYDVTSLDSYKNLKRWLTEIKEFANSSTPIMLVGTKTDLDRVITTDLASTFASTNDMMYDEVSSKSYNDSVNRCFVNFAKKLCDLGIGQMYHAPVKTITLPDKEKDSKKNPCCG